MDLFSYDFDELKVKQRKVDEICFLILKKIQGKNTKKEVSQTSQ